MPLFDRPRAVADRADVDAIGRFGEQAAWQHVFGKVGNDDLEQALRPRHFQLARDEGLTLIDSDGRNTSLDDDRLGSRRRKRIDRGNKNTKVE
jgi:hypothetical protein